MSVTKTSQNSSGASTRPHPAREESRNASSTTIVDTSNLTPGAARRYEKLIRSIDDFTAAVRDKSITLSSRK